MQQKGPLLLACNHPNSFLDALVLGAFFKYPVHFLARGDVFKNKRTKKFLTALKLIPVYRLNEGKKYLALNNYTFMRCKEILVNGGIVLIFSEGICINEWELRPLKKGTARLALSSWKERTDKNFFPVLPVSFNYSSFTDFRKTVVIAFGEPISYPDISNEKNNAKQILLFNKLLQNKLETGILFAKNRPEIIGFLLNNLSDIKNKRDVISIIKKKQDCLANAANETFLDKLRKIRKIALKDADVLLNIILIIVFAIPALAGLVLNLPVYLPINYFIKRKTRSTVFYHSALFGALIIIYPLYVFVIALIVTGIFKKMIFFSIIIIMPLSAFIFLNWKDCFDSLISYRKLSKEEIYKLQKAMRS